MFTAGAILPDEAVRRPASNKRTMFYIIDAAWTTAGTGTSWFYPQNHMPFGRELDSNWSGYIMSFQPFCGQKSTSWVEYPPDTDPAPPAPEYGSTTLIFEWVDSAGLVISEAANINLTSSGMFNHVIAGPVYTLAPEGTGLAAGLKQRVETVTGNLSGLRIDSATVGITHATLWLWKETIA